MLNRNRTVVFRVTEDEYRVLKEACLRRGARSISDFTRSEVLAFLSSGSLAENITRRFASIDVQIASIQSDLARLRQCLEGQNHAYAISQS